MTKEGNQRGIFDMRKSNRRTERENNANFITKVLILLKSNDFIAQRVQVIQEVNRNRVSEARGEIYRP